MKPFFIFLLLLNLPALAFAQRQDIALAYGDSAAGEITNQNFEAVYTFKGQKDEVVVITMSAPQDSTLDPYLYLTDTANQVISQNDDFFNLNARIITRLPATATYQIIATRLGGRTGEGEGEFDVTLEVVENTDGDITLEGTAAPGDEPPTHIFVLDAPGNYTVTYTLTEGDYFPALVLEKVNAEEFYNEEIATVGGNGLQSATMTLALEADQLYILSIQDNYYALESLSASYRVTVEPQAE